MYIERVCFTIDKKKDDFQGTFDERKIESA